MRCRGLRQLLLLMQPLPFLRIRLLHTTVVVMDLALRQSIHAVSSLLRLPAESCSRSSFIFRGSTGKEGCRVRLYEGTPEVVNVGEPLDGMYARGRLATGHTETILAPLHPEKKMRALPLWVPVMVCSLVSSRYVGRRS